MLIRTPEMVPTASTNHHSLWGEIGEGLRVLFSNKYLRAIAGEATTYNLFWKVIEAVYVLYALRELKIQAGMLGLIFALGSIGSLLGALLADRLARRFRLGPTIIGAMMVSCVVPRALPFARGTAFGVVLLAVVAFLGEIGATVSNVHAISLRQTVTPKRLLGRMNASYRFFTWGVIPLGYLPGGLLGEKIGLRPTLFIGALGLTSAWLWAAFSPVRRLRELPVSESTPSIHATEAGVAEALPISSIEQKGV